jgi:hypothetical protein
MSIRRPWLFWRLRHHLLSLQDGDGLRDFLNVLVGNGPDIVSYAALLLRELGYQELKDFNPRQHLLIRRCPDYCLFELDTGTNIGLHSQ